MRMGTGPMKVNLEFNLPDVRMFDDDRCLKSKRKLTLNDVRDFKFEINKRQILQTMYSRMIYFLIGFCFHYCDCVRSTGCNIWQLYYRTIQN